MPRRKALAPLTVTLVLVGILAPASSHADPNDPLYPQQGNLRHLRVPQALATLPRPLQPTVIAIPDTGISSTNPDLAPSLWSNPTAVPAPVPPGVSASPIVPVGAHGWNSLGTNARHVYPSNANPGDSNTDPPGSGAPDFNSANNHGTFIAGIAAAATNNGIGLTGIAPNGRLMALRTCWENDDCYQSINAPAFQWAAARGARVISMSWDWADLPAGVEAAMVAAIRDNPSTLFVGVASNGNGSYDQSPNNFGYYPCALNRPGDPAAGAPLPNFLCTTATSDVGLCGFTGRDVDLAAYVDEGFSTLPAFQGDGFTPLGCSTSAAATTVDGIAALLFGLDPQASGAQVKNWLLTGVAPDSGLTGQVASGGQLDALGAVSRLEADLWTPTLSAATVSSVTSSSVHISGSADSRGIAGEHVTATVGSAGGPSVTVPLNPDGTYALDLSGLPAASHVSGTLTVFADGIGAPPWVAPGSHVLQAQTTFTVSTAAAVGGQPGAGGHRAASARPTVGPLRVSSLRRGRKGRRRSGALLSVRIDPHGIPTTWSIQTLRTTRHPRRRRLRYTTAARGTIGAGRPATEVTARVYGRAGRKLLARVVAHNAWGTTTGTAQRVRLRR